MLCQEGVSNTDTDTDTDAMECGLVDGDSIDWSLVDWGANDSFYGDTFDRIFVS